MSGKAEKKLLTDWEAIEREFRAGQLSVLQIAKAFGISHTAINKKAKALGWTRDLSDQVRKEISARLVSARVSTPTQIETKEAVETAAERGVALVLSHRKDISSARDAVGKLLKTLHDGIDGHDEIVDLIHEATEPGPEAPAYEKATLAKRRAKMLAAIELPTRSQVINSLASALKTLIPLEREAFNLDGRRDRDADDANVVATMTPQEAFEAYAATLAQGND